MSYSHQSFTQVNNSLERIQKQQLIKKIGKTGNKTITIDSFGQYEQRNDYIDLKIRKPDGTQESKYKHASKWTLTGILNAIPEKLQCKFIINQ